MDKSTLGELKYILNEDIFLFDEDKDSLAKESGFHAGNTDLNQVQEPASPGLTKIETKQETAPEVELEPIQVRGKFEKGILILHEEESLNAEIMDMLVKILQAVGHSMSEVGLLNSQELEGRSLDEFHAINAHVVLKFGRIKHPINAFPILDYHIHAENETEYLFADSLTSIFEDSNLKRKLWTTLKTLFNI
ncbi:hypothetical protein [Algoriphagus zhangzhouensis]|uniref:Uncharacterized protein n=1 Tax=Algoriphagus zhangzhouensis TaxID=1073327 RepID=A0A1M7Z4K7_9BACT|nr:hypothetical protein [Algoriphagus zhangzhouensis]TDY48686.1 hypothetical protein A8938_0372 [Algoriphagus zhangzhouensis]SHO59799.1 hypothetical protein SAMN04488108_0372 [Algoriphagus zhangzhouensis]